MHEDAEQMLVSHPFPPALPLVCASVCPSISVSVLRTRPPCIVLNLCFWFRPGTCQSLGFERATDVPPARTSRCSSTCHQLEMALVRIMYLRCTLRQVSAMRYPCDSGSGRPSKPPRLNLQGNHCLPSDDSRLKCFKSV